jgi:two-component system, response regulator
MASQDGRVDILMVEDNANDEELTLHELRKYHLANKIHVVRDGQEALEYVFCTGRYADRNIANQPHVILLDIKLPLIDGLEVLRRIKQDPRTRTVPVVMLTSSREERDLIESYRLGVNSYIVKPVDFDQFKESARVLGMYWLLLNRPPQAA